MEITSATPVPSIEIAPSSIFIPPQIETSNIVLWVILGLLALAGIIFLLFKQ